MAAGPHGLGALADLDAYASRIGHHAPLRRDFETLLALHRLHPLAIPFENLSTLLGETPSLDVASLEHKMVRCGRGGYCFEHNRLFAAALGSLGFRVVGLAARVLWEREPGTVMPRTHMLLAVEVDGATYLADVGFGGLTLTAPLRLEPEIEQPTPHETFRLLPSEQGFVLEAALANVWRPLYWFDCTEHIDVDFEVLNHFVATYPRSPFRSVLYCARVLADRRLGLLNGRLTVRGPGSAVERRELHTIAALRDVLTRDFGIELPEDERIERVLADVLAGVETLPRP